MATSPDTYLDGDFTRPTPVGPPQLSLPFLQNKDRVSATFTQGFWQTLETWQPADISTPHSVAKPDFYLVNETAPVRVLANIIGFNRTYARIPTPQVAYSTIPINKPAFPTNDYAGAYIDSTAIDVVANVFTPAIAGTFSPMVTGGTFTITYKTSTTAGLAYNASDAAIAAAINGLADVLTDAMTVSASNALGTTGILTVQRTIVGTGDLSNMTGNGTSLTPAAYYSTGSGSAGTFNFFAYRQNINVAKTGHGLSAATAIRISTATSGAGTLTTVATVVDADNFTAANPITNPNSTLTVYTYYRYLIRTYTPGVDRVRTKSITTFYLPGVTAGISSANDITIPDIAQNSAGLLTLVATGGTGYQTYDADALTLWTGDIYYQRVIQIDMSNL